MGWIQYAIFGLVAGAIARLLHPGKDPMNWFWTMLLGIAGAEVGGLIGGTVGIGTRSGLMSWIAAVGGSIILLAAHRYFTTRNPASISGGSTTGRVTNDDYKQAVFDDLSKGPR